MRSSRRTLVVPARLTHLLPILLAGCGAASSPSAEVPRCGMESPEAVAGREDTELGAPAPDATVVALHVRGAATVAEPLIRDAIQLPTGAPVDPSVVRADVRRILALRVFEDVRVHAEPVEGGVAIAYEVVERPLVNAASLIGDGGVATRHRVERLIGEVFRPARLARLAEKIVADRRRDGYAEARAEVRASRSGDGVAVCVEAEPGRRWIVDEVRIEGNEALDDAALTAAMATLDGRVNAAGGVYRADLLAADRERMLALYYDAGHVMARVEEPRAEWEGEALVLTIAVAEGASYRLGRLGLSGALPSSAEALRALLGLEAGATFRRSAILEAMQRVQARHEGLTITPLTEIDEERQVVHLEFQFGDPSARESSNPAPDPVGLGGPEFTLSPELTLDPELAP